MRFLGYLLILAGIALAVTAAAIYSHVWIGFGSRSIEVWKACAAFSILLFLMGFFFGKAGN